MESKKLRACVLAGMSLLALVGCSQEPPQTTPVRPVRAVKLGDLHAISGREFPGRAKAKGEVDLSFQVAGPLVALSVDVGSEVAASDQIAAIDPRDFQSAVDAAEGNLARAQANLLVMQRGARPEEIEQLKAALEEAEATARQAVAEFERYEQLVQSKAISQSEYDLAKARKDRTEAQVRTAREELNIGQTGARPEDIDAQKAEIRALQAAVDAAKNQLDDTLLKAPFKGRIAARYVDNYQTVQAKQPVVRLLDLSKIEITIQIPESLIGMIPQVKQVACRFDAFPDREIIGVVSKIGSEASDTTRTYPVTIEIDQPDDIEILPGMAATLRNQPLEADAGPTDLVVPATALFTDTSGSQSYVWVVDEAQGNVSQRSVTTGQLTPLGVPLSEGVSAGEWIVVAGVNSLREQQQVKILPEGVR